ncbi:Non-canonical non-ribosomal peptide synthetase FUB8 [Paramyrothecium foliicola]|nr:Non-canonical non-ribosomal peptide synthetase FUB8 [Paramyrothecium foliicola]
MDGSHVLINAFEHIAETEPFLPFVYSPNASNPNSGWVAITFGELSRAVNHVAWQLAGDRPLASGSPAPTVAYVGPNDVRYIIIMLACVKAGHQALFISPKNSTEAQESLLNATKCQRIWYAESFANIVKSWPIAADLDVEPVPSAKVWLESTAEMFPYNRRFEEAAWDPLVILHTSGSTGLPKPILVRQGCLYTSYSLHDLPELHGSKFLFATWAERGSKLFSPMPLFHAAGLLLAITSTILYKSPVALGIADRPLSSDLVVECLKHSGCDGAFLPPRIVEELSWSEDGIDALAKLNVVAFAGGNLAENAGDKLAERGVQLQNVIASTEFFPWPLHYQPDPKLWRYFIINSKVMGADWQKAPGDNNVYELVVRRSHPTEPGLQSIFYTFPDLSEWSTKDLFEPHPTLPDHWNYRGRADDVIVFSNGEKLNPITMEEIIAGHPLVKGALIVGRDRFQPALILEPYTPCLDKAATDAFIGDVWARVENANAGTPAHGKIVRWLTMVAPPNKPFLRAGKGTVQRAGTVQLFDEEVESLYQNAEAEDIHEAIVLNVETEASLTESIIDLLAGQLGDQRIAPEQDFFNAGIDSLKVVSLTNILQASLRKTELPFDPNTVASRVIYANPTPNLLANYLHSVLHQDGTHAPLLHDGTEQMTKMLEKYTRDLPPVNHSRPQPTQNAQAVLITGTTGSLGAYLLDQLVQSNSVIKVFALNRGGDGGLSRQPAISAARGLGTNFSKVEFLGCDLSLPDLGLGQALYDRLLETVDKVIHNAWPVNFNISVASFEPHIRGVRNLVDFAGAAAKTAPIVFLSSISTVDKWNSTEPVPEVRLDDLDLAGMGYGRSKLLGSLILDAAEKESGLPTTSIRVGQIAGPRGRDGVWNRQEFMPSLIASSVYLGALPNNLGPNETVDWIPIEDVASLILDVAGVRCVASANEIRGYFHAVNPSKVTWSQLTKTIKDYYQGRIKEIVSLEEWVSRLEESASKVDDVDRNPAIKLLETYRGMLEGQRTGQRSTAFSMHKTMQRSPTVEGLGPITPNLTSQGALPANMQLSTVTATISFAMTASAWRAGFWGSGRSLQVHGTAWPVCNNINSPITIGEVTFDPATDNFPDPREIWIYDQTGCRGTVLHRMGKSLTGVRANPGGLARSYEIVLYADTKQWDKFANDVALQDAVMSYCDTTGQPLMFGNRSLVFDSPVATATFFKSFFASLETMHNISIGDFEQISHDEVKAIFGFEDQLLSKYLGTWVEIRGGGFYYETWKLENGEWYIKELKMQRTYQKETILVKLGLLISGLLGISL